MEQYLTGRQFSISPSPPTAQRKSQTPQAVRPSTPSPFLLRWAQTQRTSIVKLPAAQLRKVGVGSTSCVSDAARLYASTRKWMERGRVRESHGRPERTRHAAPHAASFPRNRWPMMAGIRPRNCQHQPQDDGKEHWNLSSNCSNEPSSKTCQMASPCHPRSKGSPSPNKRPAE